MFAGNTLKIRVGAGFEISLTFVAADRVHKIWAFWNKRWIGTDMKK